MTLEIFFEKFHEFAHAPNAVAKMRELVLEFAVRGLLTERNPKDQADSEWCEFIEELDHRIYTSDPGPPPPFEIPDEWRWVYLNEAADCRAAAKVSPATINDSDWVLDLEDIDGASGQVVQIATFADRRSLSTKAAFEPGDVLYGKLRPYLNKVVVAAKRGFCTTEIIPLRPAPFLTPEFLRLYLRSQTFLRYAAQKNYGMKMPRLGTKDLESAEIPVPPPTEQKRIVAKVDELIALCDRLEAQQQKRETRHAALARASLARFADAPTPANLNFLFHTSYTIPPADIRKSILNLAVQGKLLPQDPNDESAKDLLVRNDESRCDTAQSDHRADKGNQPLLSGDDRWDIPDTWSWRGLADLVLFVDYRGKTPSKLSSGVRLLTAKNVRKGQINLVPEEFLSESEYEAWMTRGFSKAGDVLFTTEAPMGNAAVVELTERFALAQRVICFQAYGALDPHFLVLQILSEQFQLILDKNGTGVTAKGIKASKLKQLPIAVPPLAEQRRIVAKVEQLMSLVDALETQLTTSRRAASTLMAAVVAELLDGAREVRTQPKLALVSSAHDDEHEFALAAEAPQSSDVFIESLVIAQLVCAQGNSSFPFGRKRCTKLAYFAHRAAGDDVHSRYLKKAAGPYSPWSRYDGPEAAAVEQGYVRITGPDKKEQFLPGPRIAEISQYFDDRSIHKAVDRVLGWFGKKTTDELELLATVDFAALELRASGKEATANAIKRLIANEPEWAPKLDRAIFSDTNIAAALKELDARFRKDYHVNASGSARLAQHQ